MGQIVFVIGGCRSGKSGFALDLAERMPGESNIFIATTQMLDDEMKDRVLRHQSERGPEWTTIEAPAQLPVAIIKYGATGSVLLVDCITMWVNNLMMDDALAPNIEEYIAGLKDVLKKTECPVIIVSNEVGAGIVPENRLAREFRDRVGSLNQALAGLADQVVMSIAGIPVVIKGNEEDLCP